MAPIPLKAIEYIVNHAVLPPQLPTSAESSLVVTEGEKHLLELTLQSVQELYRYGSTNLKPTLAVLEKTLCHWANINAAGHLSTELLTSWLASVEVDGLDSSPHPFL